MQKEKPGEEEKTKDSNTSTSKSKSKSTNTRGLLNANHTEKTNLSHNDCTKVYWESKLCVPNT